jgi:hypothetical protein
MELPNKKQILIGLVLLASGAALGYGLVPSKVEIREKIVTVKSSDTERTQDKEVVRVKEKRPDGTEVVRTELRTKTRENEKTRESTEKESEKIVTRGSGLSVYGLVRGPVGDLQYGAMFTKKLLGPISVGAFGFTDKTFGLAVGLEF